MTAAARARGAVPAITAVVRGVPTVGLDGDDLDRFLRRDGIAKVSARDLGVCAARGEDGATTVAAALVLVRAAGLDVFATGGIGGVHRAADGAPGAVRDESADLVELAQSSAIVVCSGAKAILDLEGTHERLETLGIPVIGYRTSQLPGFFTGETGVPLAHRVETPEQVTAVFRAHRGLGRQAGVLVMQAPPSHVALPRQIVDAAVTAALEHAWRNGIRGAAVTPYLLAEVERVTRGRSLGANLALLERNAALAAEIAVALTEGTGDRVDTGGRVVE